MRTYEARRKTAETDIFLELNLARVRSRNISKRGYEWILEVAVKDGGDLVTKVAAVPGVVSVNLMSHDGEVRF